MWKFLLLLCPLPAFADSVVATRILRAHSTLTADDLVTVEMKIDDALTDLSQAIGLETKITIYAGKPIRARDLTSPAVVERNQVVPLAFSAGSLNILTEGRALARGSIGEIIEVMNLTSRSKVMGRIGPDGVVHVAP